VPLPVTVMWAGASTIFAEVVQACLDASKADPSKYTKIAEYVDLYCNSFADMLGRRAERAVLKRLGLTRQALVSSK
jgi:hypothetical protein